MLNDVFNLPQAVEMEKAVLAAMLLKDGAVIPTVTSILNVDDFYREEHRIIFRAILKLYNQGIAPNILSLIEELRRSQDRSKIDLTLVFALADASYTTAYAEHHAKIIKEKAILRRLIDFSSVISYNAQKDVKPLNEILSDAENLFSEIKNSAEPPKSSTFAFFFDKEFKTDVDHMKLYSNRSTGFKNIDDQQIFSPGLYVLGGLPALGITTFAWQLLEQLAKNGERCIYCSYEMSKFELFSKSLVRENFLRNQKTSITSAGIRRGNFSSSVNDILQEFKSSNLDLQVMELQEHDIDSLLFELKKFCVDKAPVIVLDYLQIVPSDFQDTSAKQAIDDIVRKLKNFQRDTNTTFIVISSFNRQNYSQPVAFESFKESGNIEYSADVVWGLQLYITNNLRDGFITKNRETIEQAKNASPRQIQLKCLKNRQGTNYDCFFNYFPANDTFITCSEDDFQDFIEQLKG